MSDTSAAATREIASGFRTVREMAEQARRTSPDDHTAAGKPGGDSVVPVKARGGAYPFITLEVYDPASPTFATVLAAKVASAPAFWKQTSVVLDLSPLTGPVDLRNAVEAVRAAGLVTAGFRATDRETVSCALALGLGRVFEPSARDQEYVSGQPERTRRPPLIINEPIRSGREVYAAGGDLIILNSVSYGARIVADGSIHVYGTLRGSAYAGFGDDPTARIYAGRLDAEVVSINGLYVSAEDIPVPFVNTRSQVRLEEGCLKFAHLP